MGKFAGLVMIAVGVGTAAYVYPLISSGPDRAEQQLADVVAISTAGLTEPKSARAPIVVAQNGSAAAVTPSRDFSNDKLAAKSIAAAPSVPVATLATRALVANPSPLVVAAVSPPVEVAARPIEPPIPQPAKRPTDEAKAKLARDIQRELKRVGCYSGDADGNWDAATRQSMGAFIDKMNATLPIEQPDHILKTLVQGHPGNACGKSCAAGQAASADGRCLPTGVLTAAPKKRDIETASTDRAPAPVPRTKQPAPARAVSSWETTVATVAPPAMAAVMASLPASEQKPVPLPGRMSIGAPAEQKSAPAVVDAPKTAKILVKPRARTQAAGQPDNADAPAQGPDVADVPAVKRAPKIAQVDKPEPRRTPRVAAYRAPPPPPRYVGVTQRQESRPSRPRFGPSIFRSLEVNGR